MFVVFRNIRFVLLESGWDQFLSPSLFTSNGTMLPASQVSGIISDLKIRLNRSMYNDMLKCHEFSGKLSENILSSTSSWSKEEFRFLNNSYNLVWRYLIGITDIYKQNNSNYTIGFRNKQLLFFKSVSYEKHTNITNTYICMVI